MRFVTMLCTGCVAAVLAAPLGAQSMSKPSKPSSAMADSQHTSMMSDSSAKAKGMKKDAMGMKDHKEMMQDGKKSDMKDGMKHDMSDMPKKKPAAMPKDSGMAKHAMKDSSSMMKKTPK